MRDPLNPLTINEEDLKAEAERYETELTLKANEAAHIFNSEYFKKWFEQTEKSFLEILKTVEISNVPLMSATLAKFQAIHLLKGQLTGDINKLTEFKRNQQRDEENPEDV